MQVTARLRHLHIAPRKVRLVADLIRGKNLERAQTILNFTTKKGAEPLYKLLKQAEANAKNNLQLDPSNLFVSKITVDEGPKYKRWEPRWRGQAYEIQKKTSHITLILDEIVKGKVKTKRAKKQKQDLIEKEPLAKKPEESIVSWEETPKQEKAKPKFKQEDQIKKPKSERGISRIFRRKSI